MTSPAAPDGALPSLPLRRFSAAELRALLDEEAAHWAEELLWDYWEVRNAVAAGIDRGTLAGRVLRDGSGPAAYCYYIQEPGRAVVGSLFARAAFRGRGHEELLLDDVLGDALGAGSERVECQTLFSTAAGADSRFVRAGFRGRARHYMLRDLAALPEPPEPVAQVRPLRKDDLSRAAEMIYRSHQGSLDAALNVTYGSAANCRHFVETLVLRNGCGRFEPAASFIAETPRGPAGVLIATRLAATNGHICQVSVLPDAQQRGIGTLLLTASLAALRLGGLSTASLSVTVENRGAYRLYERFGFRLRKAFAAHAWVRPSHRPEPRA